MNETNRLMALTMRAYARNHLSLLGLDTSKWTDEEIDEYIKNYAEAVSKYCGECGRPYDE